MGHMGCMWSLPTHAADMLQNVAASAALAFVCADWCMHDTNYSLLCCSICSVGLTVDCML